MPMTLRPHSREAAYADALKIAIAHEKEKARLYMEYAEKSKYGAKMMFTELATEAMMYLNSFMVEFEHVLRSDEIPEGEDSDEFIDIGVLKTAKIVIPEEFATPEQAILVAIKKTEESQAYYEKLAERSSDEILKTFFANCGRRMQRRAVDLKEEYERNVLTQM